MGQSASEFSPKTEEGESKDSKYLAMHLRFEIDMAAYSLCNFGGGKEEEQELESYRLVHFPALLQLKNSTRSDN